MDTACRADVPILCHSERSEESRFLLVPAKTQVPHFVRDDKIVRDDNFFRDEKIVRDDKSSPLPSPCGL